MRKILLLVFTLLLVVSCSSNESSSNNPSEDNHKDQEEEKTQNENEKSLNRPKPEQVLDQYKDTFMYIVENTEKDGKLTDITSKDELVSYFTTIMSKDLAHWYIETYFRKDGDELFLKAMDGPTWFKSEKPYTLEKVSDQKYKVIQERNNEFLGHLNMIYTLSLKDEKWIVSRIDHERLDSKKEAFKTIFTEKVAITAVEERLNIRKGSER